MDTNSTTCAASTITEDIQTAYRLIADHYQCLKYPPERAGEYISALAASLEGQWSEQVLLIISAFGFHISRGGHSKFIKQRMLIRAAEGCTLREVVWFAPERRRPSDPPVSNTGVALPTAREVE